MIFKGIFVLIFVGLINAEKECGKSESALKRYKSQIGSGKVELSEINQPFEATGHDWPWMAHYMKCSSSIIGQKWLLTAAHCKDIPVAAIVYGSDDRTFGKVAEIKTKYPHPKHQNGIPGYDIMIVELQEPLEFNENVSQICLSKTSFSTIPETKSILTGWGKLFKGLQYWVNTTFTHRITNDDILFEFTPILHDKIVHFREREYCADLKADMICAGGIGEGSTPEDSGGSMMTIINDKFYQQGIIAGGDMFTVAGRNDIYEDHGYYTDISQYCDWIKEMTKGDVECEN
uniref:Peptidase S1 domain-containing protein n=1 Tax=Panagrolaimus davidi TaxID=227884 RepID=A0A914PWY3_9BILA